jgi:hypothetical protein
LDWVRSTFRLSRQVYDEKGKPQGTVREQLESVVRQSNGKIVPEMLANEPDSPDKLLYLWGWFNEICKARRFDSMNGSPFALSYDMIYYWQKIKGIELLDDELKLLFLFDQAYLEFVREVKDGRDATRNRG